MKKLFLTAFAALCCLNLAFGQMSEKPDKPAASPHQVVKQAFALSHITIDYSRPGVKGREIFGGLVPYDKVWRTGANAVTTIEFGLDVKLNGHLVKAGKYAVYTIPTAGDWTIILNKDIDVWGTEYAKSDDVVRFQATPVPLSFSIETFTINIDKIRDNSCILYLAWDQTYVPIEVTTVE